MAHLSRRGWFLLIPTAVLAVLVIQGAVGDLVRAPADDSRRAAVAAAPVLEAEAVNAVAYLDQVQSEAEVRIKRRLAEMVDVAHGVLGGVVAAAGDDLPRERVAALAREALREARFLDGRGYFFVDTMDGRVVLLPIDPAQEGADWIDNRDDNGTYVMRELIAAVRQPGGRGYVEYSWYRPDDPERMSRKIAYARHFAPLDWLVGAGEYVEAMEAALRTEALERLAALRFGGGGRIGILDADGDLLLAPGGVPWASQVAERLEEVGRAGGGLVEVSRPNAATGRAHRHLAWVTPPTDQGWLVVAEAGIGDFLPPAPAPSTGLAPQWRLGLAAAMLLLAAAMVWWPVRGRK